ncbi:MAG: co-chaperone GroES [Myxococcales bacterium]|nr:co-chaperone GroES [Myxococcales bacterium]MCB9642255.1 co-chaperone GroES [Myxococcales bacterium]
MTQPDARKKTTPKTLIVIGDRVLIKLDEEEKRTEVGLYLPDTVRDKDDVQAGTIVKTGPGTPLMDPLAVTEEPWDPHAVSVRYMPMQARVGDYTLFLRKAAVEIQYEGENYLLAPQSALLVLIRGEQPVEELQ